MSPSKKANKKTSTNKSSKSAQNMVKKTSARSSRVTAKEAEQTLVSEFTQPTAYNKPKSSNFLMNALRVLALFAVILITVYIYSIRTRVGQFAAFGYPGIFMIALLANATVLLPAPGVAVIYAMGAIFNPFGVGLAAGTGGAIGELSGYFAGFSGQAVVERMDIYDRVKPWVDKYGGWTIMVLSAIPNPFFDAAGIAAGIAKMPLRTFLVFTWFGQLIKMTAFALAGHYSISLLTNFLK
ncbi:MAG TPA: VTT domain-containing protein [Anaerolineales bacterium]|nr:VTT domain-containing protein [Anaerolineales bacterium]